MEDLYSMMPWERQIVIAQVMQALEKEKESGDGMTNLFDQ
tara:strand:- start:1165 stop:1284 length:120 start_codon:yes stop_codon:yes gene_type:complete